MCVCVCFNESYSFNWFILNFFNNNYRRIGWLIEEKLMDKFKIVFIVSRRCFVCSFAQSVGPSNKSAINNREIARNDRPIIYQSRFNF